MKIAPYDPNLTAAQWHRVRRFLPAAKKRGRPRTDLRAVLNAILYLLKTGAHWRLRPKTCPKWPPVYPNFRRWSRGDRFARLNGQRRKKVRQAAGRKPQPPAASLASQPGRASAHKGEVG